MAEPTFEQEHILTREGKSKLPVWPNDELDKRWANFEKRLPFIAHAQSTRCRKHADRLMKPLFNLPIFTSNHYTGSSVSFDSFIGLIWWFWRPWKWHEMKPLKIAVLSIRASERVTKSLSTFLVEVVTMKAAHSDSHSFLHTVISVQPLQSDMQFCSLTKMQIQQRTEK